MAIVVYKCDVCKRDIELKRNVRGLEKIQRCVITHGCRGKLYQIDLLQDYVRGNLPDQVAGLDDWRQRKVLYNHIQSIENDTWIIKHNLGTFPSISVFVDFPSEDNPDNTIEIIPEDTIIVDEDNIILKLDRAYSGLAQLVSRQSDPDLLRPNVGIKIEPEVLQQLSFGGELTIATRVSSIGDEENIELGATYTTTENAIVNTVYTADSNLPDTKSPWRDIDKVIIKGKIYTIRSFDAILTPEMVDGTINSGSTFIFTTISSKPNGSPATTHRAIAQDEVYLLFAQEPFDSVDKLTNQYIDVFDVTTTENQFAFVYDSGEFLSTKTVIQTIYPLIRSV